MFKLMRLKELSIRMSAAGSSSLEGAEYVLSPISARLQLAHVPLDQVLQLRLEVGMEELAEITLRRSQVIFRGTCAESVCVVRAHTVPANFPTVPH